MPKLSLEERAKRDADRIAAQTTRVKTGWSAKLQVATELIPEAQEIWAQVWGAHLDIRGLWLILGLFETQEKIQAAGKYESIKTKWFDSIAPRKYGISYGGGVSGFTTRTVAKTPQFVAITGNGYVFLTDLGFALVLFLRSRFAELNPENITENRLVALEVPELGILPAALWRRWEDWQPV